jgi:hypothetical protein
VEGDEAMSYDNWKTTNPEDETLGDEFEATEDEEADLPEVVTFYNPPPIPIRAYDWCAHREGAEESGPYGYGTTRQEALTNLFNLEEDGF